MRNNFGCYSNFGCFSIAPCKVITYNLLCFIFGIISMLLCFISLYFFFYGYRFPINVIAILERFVLLYISLLILVMLSFSIFFALFLFLVVALFRSSSVIKKWQERAINKWKAQKSNIAIAYWNGANDIVIDYTHCKNSFGKNSNYLSL